MLPMLSRSKMFLSVEDQIFTANLYNNDGKEESQLDATIRVY